MCFFVVCHIGNLTQHPSQELRMNFQEDSRCYFGWHPSCLATFQVDILKKGKPVDKIVTKAQVGISNIFVESEVQEFLGLQSFGCFVSVWD